MIIYRLFLIVRIFYSYVILATFLLQFYVPMDFMEPPVNKAIERLKEKFHLESDTVNVILLSAFRTVIILLIGMSSYLYSWCRSTSIQLFLMQLPLRWLYLTLVTSFPW